MNYYAYYANDGRIIYKEATESFVGGENVKELSEAAYNSLDIAVEQEIFDLKKALSETDYIACKIAEGAATVEEYSFNLSLRQQWRDRINQLLERS